MLHDKAKGKAGNGDVESHRQLPTCSVQQISRADGTFLSRMERIHIFLKKKKSANRQIVFKMLPLCTLQACKDHNTLSLLPQGVKQAACEAK